jgi:hypothetical protein
LVTKPIRAFDGVEHVPPPVVVSHVSEACGNASLSGNSMTSCGEDFGDASCV